MSNAILTKMKLLLISAVMIASANNVHAKATNLTKDFLDSYNNQTKLSAAEINKLRNHDIYLIPGILAETLVKDDDRTFVKFTFLLKDYYESQLDLLNNKYKIPAKRLVTSSHDVNISKANIRKAVSEAKKKNRKVIFISHSLGGLVLLEEVLENKTVQNNVAGIAFLQSPFYGTEIANFLMNPPYNLEKPLKSLLPILHISENTMEYVGKSRKNFMKQNASEVIALNNKIPFFTVSSTAKANKSIFKPAIDLNESGCLKAISDKCITDVIFHGEYDKTDGLIPMKSSFLPGTDYVFLKDVDHAELVLKTPYEKYKKEHVTNAILKLLLKKMK